VPPLALLHWQLVPVAHAKAKRLGRDLSVKIELLGSCSIVLIPAGPPAGGTVDAGDRRNAAGRGDSGGDGGGARETYAVQLPSLLLLDPLSSECPVVYKGEWF
jgi:hypothetical protein